MSSRGAWSDTEKLRLLMSIVETHVGSAIKWNTVNIPPGRTVKSCTHVIAKLRDDARNGGASGNPVTTEGQEKGKNKKRKNESSGDDAEDEEFGKQQSKKKKMAAMGTKGAPAKGTIKEQPSSPPAPSGRKTKMVMTVSGLEREVPVDAGDAGYGASIKRVEKKGKVDRVGKGEVHDGGHGLDDIA